jgi:hypothetical protein
MSHACCSILVEWGDFILEKDIEIPFWVGVSLQFISLFFAFTKSDKSQLIKTFAFFRALKLGEEED